MTLEHHHVEELKRIGTSSLGSVLDDLGVRGHILNIKAIGTRSAFAGTAFTVKMTTAEAGTYTIQDLQIANVLDRATSGHAIMIDMGGAQVSCWGGGATLASQLMGVAGIVIDGGSRDVDEIREVGLPVFARYTLPLSGRSRVKIAGMGEAIQIDGVKVSPGDIVVGDGSGVLSFPSEFLEQVLERGRDILRRDEIVMAALRRGATYAQAMALGREG